LRETLRNACYRMLLNSCELLQKQWR